MLIIPISNENKKKWMGIFCFAQRWVFVGVWYLSQDLWKKSPAQICLSQNRMNQKDNKIGIVKEKREWDKKN